MSGSRRDKGSPEKPASEYTAWKAQAVAERASPQVHARHHSQTHLETRLYRKRIAAGRERTQNESAGLPASWRGGMIGQNGATRSGLRMIVVGRVVSGLSRGASCLERITGSSTTTTGSGDGCAPSSGCNGSAGGPVLPY